ncbi:MAG: phosphohydrolase [Spirochaetae bacterium HGW-Spirochaetae-9]|nr:MAG: phosphohydrolase [Spirochaetae bacterium HGW-Spirochaetae-9]
MTDIAATLNHAGIPCWEYGLTAIDAYIGHVMKSPIGFYLVEGSIVDLARNFEKLEYPSLPYADASLGAETAGFEARFLCVDTVHKKNLGSLVLTDFRRNPLDGRFHDPQTLYPALKERLFNPENEGGENALFETALYVSRLQAIRNPQAGADAQPASMAPLPRQAAPLWQRDLLSLILQGEHSAAAFDFLKDCGFIKTYWTDLDALLLVDHAKDCHPEGGGWSHTMEALGYRKSLDLTVSLAILLHDIGKPHAASSEGRRFDKHAEIGARLAARFLRTLGFSSRIVDDVAFMIRWHMLPAALPRIPISSVSDIVMDSRFIDLLEVFRCDEFSTFKGPDVYYASCAAYKAFIKNSRNPYRDKDGRKKAEIYSRR